MIQKDNDFTRDMIRKRLGQGQDGINKYLVRILTLAIVEAASLVMDVSEKLNDTVQIREVRVAYGTHSILSPEHQPSIM